MIRNLQIVQVVNWICRILFISFFLPAKWQTFIMIAFSACTIIYSVYKKILVEQKEFLLAFLLGGGFLFYLAWIPFTPDIAKGELLSLIERKISLFLFPFVFLLFTKITTITFRTQLPWFSIGFLAMSFYANLRILFVAIGMQGSQFSDHVTYRIAFEQYAQIHPSYFGMYGCFAIAILWLYGSAFFVERHWLSYLLQFLILISLILLVPKTAMVALILIFIYAMIFVFSYSPRIKVYIGLILALILPCIYLLIPFVHQRVGEVLYSFSHITPNMNNSVDMRSLLVTFDLMLLKDHWLFGLGPAELQSQLNLLLYYFSFYAGHPLGTYNTHNEYLNQWLSFGLFGFLFFISILWIHVWRAIRRKQTIYLFLMMILMTMFLTENILSRQHGILFFALFTSLFYFSPADNEPDRISVT